MFIILEDVLAIELVVSGFWCVLFEDESVLLLSLTSKKPEIFVCDGYLFKGLLRIAYWILLVGFFINEEVVRMS